MEDWYETELKTRITEREALLEKIIKETWICHGENLLSLEGEVEITDAEQAYISSITERST